MSRNLPTEAAIEDLEHESGLRPLGEYPDHCARCAGVANIRAVQAACPHDVVTEVMTADGRVVARWCGDCGARRSEPESS